MAEQAKKIVVTGQQIGLLGGPLYTTYKVLGAVHRAQTIAGQAVYWLETNDADFNEINRIDYQDASGSLQSLTWAIDSRGYSCGLIEVDDTLPTIIEKFFADLRQTDFTPALKELALRCYVPGRTLGEASAQLAEALFGRFGVRVFSPSEKAFRDVSRTILLKEAERTPDGEQCSLFCMVGKKREALFKRGGAYVLRDGTTVDLSRHDLVPNVKTRSICQDAFFHTHTYIAGLAEQHYLAELDPLYRFHGVKKAAVEPRMSVTLIEPKAARLMQKCGVSLADVLALERAELVKKGLKDVGDFDHKETLARAQAAGRTLLESLESLGLEVKEIGKLVHSEIKKVCGKKRAQEKERHRGIIESLQFLSDNLKPFGKRQERVFNLFYYMNLYGGLDFIDRLYERYDAGSDVLEIDHG